MEQHPNGTCIEINASRELISAISQMTEAQRAALPHNVRSAYDQLWQMWLDRRAEQHSQYCIGDLPPVEPVL